MVAGAAGDDVVDGGKANAAVKADVGLVVRTAAGDAVTM